MQQETSQPGNYHETKMKQQFQENYLSWLDLLAPAAGSNQNQDGQVNG